MLIAATDWTSTAALITSMVALAAFVTQAVRGRRSDDLDVITTINTSLREDNDDLRSRVGQLEERVDDMEAREAKALADLVHCQRETARLKRLVGQR